MGIEMAVYSCNVIHLLYLVIHFSFEVYELWVLGQGSSKKVRKKQG